MTTGGDTRRPAAALSWRALADFCHTLDLWTGAALRSPRPTLRPDTYRTVWQREAWAVVAVVAVVLAAMLLIDAPAFRFANTLPHWLNRAFNEFTDFGRSGWTLYPLGVLYLMTVALASTPVSQWTYRVLAAVAVRLGFLFVAIGLPGLVVTIVKRLIGRVRPSEHGPFAYMPFSWRSDYASLPSGHTTAAFATLVAFGALFPRLRPYLWTFAVLIAISRVVVSSHFVSDTIAGAACGALGAILVRDWFAARRLAFVIHPDGEARPLPGPSWQRLKRVAGAVFAP
jgi:membrane-associated phospholipid phosphatase